jgi:hypothetical protein
MPIYILRLLASVLSLALIVSTSATAEPKLEMHRVGVNVDDGSGGIRLFRPRARSRSSCQFPSMISQLATRARTK